MNFATFTRRTEDPKLAWLERELARAGIASRRNGASAHAPILEVDASRLDDAWAILDPVDDVPDDDARFSTVEPEPGTYAYTARLLASIMPDEDWDAWKDEMKERDL